MSNMSTWREMLAEAMGIANDVGPVVAYAPDAAAFDVAFDNSYGTTNGPSVLAWTEKNVYFPAVYDGAEWIESAPRNPTTKGQYHCGGG